MHPKKEIKNSDVKINHSEFEASGFTKSSRRSDLALTAKLDGGGLSFLVSLIKST